LFDKKGSYLLSNIVCAQEVDIDNILNLLEAAEKFTRSISFYGRWSAQDSMTDNSTSQSSKAFYSHCQSLRNLILY
jgi:hypothetical protein